MGSKRVVVVDGAGSVSQPRRDMVSSIGAVQVAVEGEVVAAVLLLLGVVDAATRCMTGSRSSGVVGVQGEVGDIAGWARTRRSGSRSQSGRGNSRGGEAGARVGRGRCHGIVLRQVSRGGAWRRRGRGEVLGEGAELLLGLGARLYWGRRRRRLGMEQRAAAAMAFIVRSSRVSIANGGWPRHPYPCPHVEHLQLGADGALMSRLGVALPFSVSCGGWVLGHAPLLARVGDGAGAALGLVTWAVEGGWGAGWAAWLEVGWRRLGQG